MKKEIRYNHENYSYGFLVEENIVKSFTQDWIFLIKNLDGEIRDKQNIRSAILTSYNSKTKKLLANVYWRKNAIEGERMNYKYPSLESK